MLSAHITNDNKLQCDNRRVRKVKKNHHLNTKTRHFKFISPRRKVLKSKIFQIKRSNKN